MKRDGWESGAIKTSRNLKKRFIVSLCALILTSALFVVSTVAWITQLFEENLQAEFGKVDVDIVVFFYDGSPNGLPGKEVVIDDNGTPENPLDDQTKPGVYAVNITENSSNYFFDDFRVKVNVLSSVPTYFRVRIIEQLTFIYYDINDHPTEVSIINDDYMPFLFDILDENEEMVWFDNRDVDGYIYYMSAVQRIDEGVPRPLNLISSPPEETFNTYGAGYSLQIAFSIEAVQSLGGPAEVWGLTTPPWPGGTSW